MGSDCRELKIGPFCNPCKSFHAGSLRWIESAYPEIIELLSKHLLSRLPYAEELVNAIYTRADWPYGEPQPSSSKQNGSKPLAAVCSPERADDCGGLENDSSDAAYLNDGRRSGPALLCRKILNKQLTY